MDAASLRIQILALARKSLSQAAPSDGVLNGDLPGIFS